MTELLHELNGYVEGWKQELRELSDYVWEHPELAYKEHLACAKQVELLKAHGCDVTTPAYGIDTAYVTEYANGEGPVFAIAAEYDALPGVGHGCGHNLICASGVAGFLAARNAMKAHDIKGRLILLGTPAEESGGGKVMMLRKGCLDGVDAVMMLHPRSYSLPDPGSTAIRRFTVEFKGKAVHASDPANGKNALDAVMLLFAGVNAFRQQMPEFTRIHGIVQDGGKAPNIIPDHASAYFFVRSIDDAWEDRLEDRFRKIVAGAAMMTDTEYTITPSGVPCMSRKPNQPMNALFCQLMMEQGLVPDLSRMGDNRGSSDFGDFSHKCPGIHGYFGIADHDLPGHSVEMAQAAKSDMGFENAMKGAAVMGAIAIRFMTDAAFRSEVKKDFSK